MIDERTFRLRERDGIALAARIWSNEAPPRALMVVAHGMGEHAARYREPLAPLIESGIHVYALDHRGHGASVEKGATFGDFGLGGYAGVVSDLGALVDLARSENPGVPLVLFGHSMGSMIAQGYVLDASDRIDALVLCGSVAVDVVAQTAAANPEIFAAMNAPFEPGRTGFEWLSRDEAQIDLYVADPWCGFSLIPKSFGDLLAHGTRLADPEAIGSIRKDLLIDIVSGDHDPLVLLVHGLAPLIERYREAGLHVDVTLYPDARHEILNEMNRDEVVADLRKWVGNALGLSS